MSSTCLWRVRALQEFVRTCFQRLPVALLPDGCSLGLGAVTVALRHRAPGLDPAAAHWDFELLDGRGGWRPEGCHITTSGGDATTILCSQHNKNLAVLMVSTLPPPRCSWM